MASGLKNYSLAKQEWPAMKLMLSDDIEDTALSIPVLEAPFTRFNYKNADSQIAGAVIRRAAEKAGKGDYASYASSALWCPLGNAPATLWLEDKGGAPRFYAGLQANLMDWARLGQLLLDQGKVGDKQVVPADWISTMTTPSRNNPNYGLQVWLGSPYVERRAYNSETPAKAFHSKPYLADDVIYLDGFGGQRVYVVPSRRLVIARTGNPNMKFDDAVLVNLALAALPAPAPTPLVTP
jgi:CubicO group peptidase (beta-lactamase class C family)